MSNRYFKLSVQNQTPESITPSSPLSFSCWWHFALHSSACLAGPAPFWLCSQAFLIMLLLYSLEPNWHPGNTLMSIQAWVLWHKAPEKQSIPYLCIRNISIQLSPAQLLAGMQARFCCMPDASYIMVFEFDALRCFHDQLLSKNHFLNTLSPLYSLTVYPILPSLYHQVNIACLLGGLSETADHGAMKQKAWC